jgi:hypothetical protein
MKKTLTGAALTALSLGVFGAAPAFATENPGSLNNCVGATTQYVARDGSISPFISANGIGNVATANGASATNVMDYIKVVVCP